MLLFGKRMMAMFFELARWKVCIIVVFVLIKFVWCVSRVEH